MLSYLLGLLQEFERVHGQIPTLVSLNTRHMKYLLEECPNLVSGAEPFPFGFRISVYPENELAHPVVSMLPVTRHVGLMSRSDISEHIVDSPNWESATSFLVRRTVSQQ